MTSLSTVASVAFLPLNVLLYVSVAYENTQDFSAEEVDIDFADLGITLGIVIAAVFLGLILGSRFPQYQYVFNVVGNVAGMGSIILGIFASSDTCDGKAPWEQAFYPLWVATAVPLLVGLLGVMLMTKMLGLAPPQRVAIALETAYQNTSIALAYTLGQGVAGRRAAGVPVIYGGYEAGFFGLFMLFSWKAGWTYAPANDPLKKVLFDNYQPGGENHRRMFPNYYDVKPEAAEFSDSLRKSFRGFTDKFQGPSSSAAEASESEQEENDNDKDKDIEENISEEKEEIVKESVVAQ